MKINKFSNILLLIIWLCACNSPATTTHDSPTPSPHHTQTDDTIIIATGDWPPYTIVNTQTGVFIELTTEAFARAGIAVEYHFYSSWARAEQDTLDGLAYAALPYYQTDERSASFDFSSPVLQSKTGFFYYMPQHPNGIQYAELEDLRAYRIGGVLGYWYEPMFSQAGLDVDYVTNEQQAIEKLYLGRVDLMPANHNNMQSLIAEAYPNETEQFAPIEPLLAEETLHLMVSRHYPNAPILTQQFNQALEEMRQDGTYQQILEKYNL